MDQTERVRRHFDQLADGEWERLDANPRTRVSFEIHRRFLAERVSAGNRVLEIGAGPGRFTIALAEMGARVVVSDIGVAADDAIFETGDLRHEGRAEGHTCQMCRWREVEALVGAAGGEVVSASASNWASLGHEETLAQLGEDPAGWRRFLDHEVSACREPGLLDAGTRILFAARAVAWGSPRIHPLKFSTASEKYHSSFNRQHRWLDIEPSAIDRYEHSSRKPDRPLLLTLPSAGARTPRPSDPPLFGPAVATTSGYSSVMAGVAMRGRLYWQRLRRWLPCWQPMWSPS